MRALDYAITAPRLMRADRVRAGYSLSRFPRRLLITGTERFEKSDSQGRSWGPWVRVSTAESSQEYPPWYPLSVWPD